MRVLLARLGPGAFRLFWTFHHVLIDGFSIASVLHEVLTCHEALCAGRSPALPPAPTFRLMSSGSMQRRQRRQRLLAG